MSPRARRWLWGLGAGALVVAGWALLRRAGPDLAGGPAALQTIALRTARRPAGISLAIGLFAVAGVCFVPLTVLAAVTLAAFGSWPGLGIAWTGGVVAAALSHLAGGYLGRGAIAWLAARVGRDPGPLLRRHGFWSGVVARLLPGNFGAANLLAGALAIPRLAFLGGNALGLSIELCGLGIVIARARAVLAAPTPGNVLSAALVAGGVLGVGIAVGRALRRHLKSRSGPLAQ
jgi:phospholipase D1/2